MADRGDTHYHVPTLNGWFLFASVFFTLTMVWTVLDDASAEWKDYQREFKALELSKAEAELNELSEQGLLDRQVELQQAIDAAESAVAARSDELEGLAKTAYETKEAHYNREQILKGKVANWKWDILVAEKATAKKGLDDPEVQDLYAKLADTKEEVASMTAEVEELAAAKQAAADAYAAAQNEVSEAEKVYAIQLRELIRVEEKIETLDPSQLAVKAANVVRDFPGLDFIEPTLKVQKYVLDGIEENLNFTRKDRIDMCTTCHMGIEREAYSNEPNPYRSHPRLDLYLSSKSPHPVKDFGCTVCHRGHGESLSFQHVDHRPDNDDEKKAWEDEYHWHKQHHWDYPMLQSQHTEASCVQCHKTSMELIADDAPELTKGYQLVERYGCYACHKIDWFPTKRRPGPSLLQMKGKLSADFVEGWINKPRDFRPTTWMPQVFHLSNYAPDEVIVEKSRYDGAEPGGRAILGQEWNDQAVAAITAFLFANEADTSFPAIPVVGDAERGREVMNVSGCYACHNTAAFPGQELAYENLSDQVDRFNTKGPNLRGVATKITSEWLYAWLKDPAAYWHDTNMPNLRLTDRDAADITAYIMEDPDGIFMDVPEGWNPTRVAYEREVLEEQARWFYQKEGRSTLKAKMGAGGEWESDQALAVAVGQAFVMNQGCFSCHEISGMQSMMPIGAELTNWASKTVDKLDFGLSYQHTKGQDQAKLELPASLVAQAEHVQSRGPDNKLPWLDHHYHDGWLKRKLAHPRSFDLAKVKNPKEKLRMPWFDLSPDEIDAIATFVLGLVNDDVPGKKMIPTPEQLAMDEGHRALRQKNCAACHVVDHGEIHYHRDGMDRTLVGEVLPFPDEVTPPPTDSWESFQAAMTEWAEYWEEDLPESIVVRLTDVNADVGAPSENVEVAVADLEAWMALNPGLEPFTQPYGGDFVELVTRYYQQGVSIPNPDYDPAADPDSDEAYPDLPWTWLADDDGNPQVEDVDGLGRYYQETERDKLRWTFAPPVLVNEGHKLQRDWFFSFLKDPYQLRQQIRVRMPSFHYEAGEAEAIADYFAGKARHEWPARYARTARLTMGRNARAGLADGSTENRWSLPTDENAWPETVHVTNPTAGLTLEDVAAQSGLSADKIRAIEEGYQPEIAANFQRLHEFYEGIGFNMTGQVPLGYEQILRTSPTWLSAHAELIPTGQLVAEKGVNCYQCHPGTDGSFQQDPIAWAPALQNTRARLREEWVREWLWSPARVFPGTAMPDNFSSDEPQYQDQYPGSTNAQQIEAVMDWLYNMEGGAISSGPPSAGVDQMSDEQIIGILRSRGIEVDVAGDDSDSGDGGAGDGGSGDGDSGSDAGGSSESPGDDLGAADPDTPEPPSDGPDVDDLVDDGPVGPAAPVGGEGVLVGRVIFDGTVPEAKELTIKPAQEEGCHDDGSRVDRTDYSLMVDPTSKGIKNVVISIEVDGAPAPAGGSYVVDQEGCRFTPHVLVMPIGAEVEYKNSDATSHNIHTYSSLNPSLNKTVAGGGSLKQTLPKEEVIKVKCDLHPWMGSHIVVTEATHFAVTDGAGQFRIAGLPPGEHKVAIWHETLGKAKQTVTVPASGEGEAVEIKMGGSGGRRRRR